MQRSTFGDGREHPQYTEMAGLLGKQIRTAREKKKMKQYDLAFKADVSKESLSNIERGARVPSLDMLIRLLRALGRTTINIGKYKSYRKEDTLGVRRAS